MLKEMMDRAIKLGGVDAAWNTGREYSVEKQRMSARVGDAGQVFFSDIDRSISGVLAAPFARSNAVDPAALASFVMREYDEGRYTSGFYHLPDTSIIGKLQSDLRGAAAQIDRDGLRIPKANELPGVAGAALQELFGYPQSATVAELYDNDAEFAAALRTVVGEEFEYPDFSHKKIGDVVLKYVSLHHDQSVADASMIASGKGSISLADPQVKQSVTGKVIGHTGLHTVLSLGRSALVIANADLTKIPAKGEEVAIDFKGGKGSVSEIKSVNEIGR